MIITSTYCLNSDKKNKYSQEVVSVASKKEEGNTHKTLKLNETIYFRDTLHWLLAPLLHLLTY